MALIALNQRKPAYIEGINTRADYLNKFGKAAPEFDYSRPVKTWKDTRPFADPDEEVEYLGVKYDSSNGEPIYDALRVVTLQKFKLFPEIAASVNLLPDPLPPQGALTPNQLRMVQRRNPMPLDLLPGERVVLAPGIGTIPVVDDGLSQQPTAGGSFTQADRALLASIRADQVIHGSRLDKILGVAQDTFKVVVQGSR